MFDKKVQFSVSYKERMPAPEAAEASLSSITWERCQVEFTQEISSQPPVPSCALAPSHSCHFFSQMN